MSLSYEPSSVVDDRSVVDQMPISLETRGVEPDLQHKLTVHLRLDVCKASQKLSCSKVVELLDDASTFESGLGSRVTRPARRRPLQMIFVY